MKRSIALLLPLVCVFALAGCGTREEERTGEVTAAKTYFEAIILEVADTYLLVEPFEGTPERKSADRINVGTDKIGDEESLNYLAEAETGDTVQIGYHGEIAESYPAQIGSAFEIKLIAGAEAQEEVKTEAETDVFQDKIPMVMVRGRLYYDTGKESTITGRCGVMDGTITSTVDGTQIPAEDDQSNFGTGYEYQFTAEDTIELVINNKWIVFEDRNGVGTTTPGENPVQPEEEVKTEYTVVNNMPGVTMEIKENTLSDHGLTITVRNESDYDLTFGTYYCVEKEIDGSWYQVPYREQEHEIGWNDIGYEVLANSSYEFEATDWEWLYGTLEAGRYRLVKKSIVGRGDDITEYFFTVEFLLTE